MRKKEKIRLNDFKRKVEEAENNPRYIELRKKDYRSWHDDGEHLTKAEWAEFLSFQKLELKVARMQCKLMQADKVSMRAGKGNGRNEFK